MATINVLLHLLILYLGLQGLQVAALLYRREEPDLYMVLSKEHLHPSLTSAEIDRLFPASETSPKDIRLVSPKLTSEDRSQLLLSRKLSMATADSGLDINGRFDQKYSPKYTKEGLTKRVGDSEKMVPGEEANGDTRPLQGRSYINYQQRRVDNKNPDISRDYYKTTDLKKSKDSMKSQASFKDDEDTYDIKTLAKIIKNLRAEKDEEDDQRPRTRIVDNQQPLKPEGQRSLAPRFETGGPEAKEHILKLLDELDRLEALGKVQAALGSNESEGFLALKQELAQDARALRLKVRKALRTMQ